MCAFWKKFFVICTFSGRRTRRAADKPTDITDLAAGLAFHNSISLHVLDRKTKSIYTFFLLAVSDPASLLYMHVRRL